MLQFLRGEELTGAYLFPAQPVLHPLLASERGNPFLCLGRNGRGIGGLAIHRCHPWPIPSCECIQCSPQALRRTFAIEFLRGGGNLFELQALMGHESLDVLRRDVAVAETDVAAAHRRASPTDRLKVR